MLLNPGLPFTPAFAGGSVRAFWVSVVGRRLQLSGRSASAEGVRVNPGAGVLKESWV